MECLLKNENVYYRMKMSIDGLCLLTKTETIYEMEYGKDWLKLSYPNLVWAYSVSEYFSQDSQWRRFGGFRSKVAVTSVHKIHLIRQ